ncbi:hypothetical protein ACGF1Z_31415 [Streptomyces sp. NPDC048018]|uniref:hypothetical protein n=1 Tax=Streptomyces sp. NPDC048018 TaxID=3365499 RepID=UPI0037124710
MKLTRRDNWRVVIEIHPQHTHINISELGFPGIAHHLNGTLSGAPLELTIVPRRLGDFGSVSIGDRLVSNDTEGDYQRRCEEMLAALLHKPHVRSGRVDCDEKHTCSHCGLRWEEMTAAEAADSFLRFDDHSIGGEPVCCRQAIDEFRQERGVPALTKEGDE